MKLPEVFSCIRFHGACIFDPFAAKQIAIVILEKNYCFNRRVYDKKLEHLEYRSRYRCAHADQSFTLSSPFSLHSDPKLPLPASDHFILSLVYSPVNCVNKALPRLLP